MREFYLGNFLKNGENLHTEYKEFCMKENIYKFFSEKQISIMLRNSIIPRKFDDVIMYNMCKYIDIYIAKYAASHHNSLNTQKKMSFMIGIDDYAEITGIPYTKNLKDDIGFIHRYIKRTLCMNLNEMCCIKFNLRINKCKIDLDLLDDGQLANQLSLYDKHMNWYNIKYRKYNKKRKLWIKSVMKYKGKLQMVYEDMDFQEEFKEYLKSEDKMKTFNAYFNSKYTIDVDKIKDCKTDPTSFVYWLIKFKDMKVQELMKHKPKAPALPKIQNVEMSSVTQLTQLRRRWLEQNKKLNYFVVSVELYKKEGCNNHIKYCDPRRHNWRLIERCMKHGGIGPYSKDV